MIIYGFGHKSIRAPKNGNTNYTNVYNHEWHEWKKTEEKRIFFLVVSFVFPLYAVSVSVFFSIDEAGGQVV